MKNKVCVVTGANAGLGYATTLFLAEQKATVYMVCRSKERGEQAQEEIKEKTGNEKVFLVLADLAEQEQIQKASEEILQQSAKVNVLINNAAMVVSRRKTNGEGIELQFAVNHLSYFLLTHYLMPALRSAEEARVINVGSANHRRGKIHFDDLFLKQKYHPLKAYNQSKLANLLFTFELDRQLKAQGISHITTNCADPGLNNTGIGSKNTIWLHRLLWGIRRLQGKQPGEGAECQIYLATSSKVKGLSGQYWYDSEPAIPSPAAQNKEHALKLWEKSLSICEIEDYFSQ